ncbi:hypothetical protein TWF694_006231 [Orbilia ellipsospora]|uniref:Uncharacterized protein n=1 Tax=Orbilia ellipsospora TaxID=2528407 RepID=A0AAV9XL58_9PEZI
MQIIAALTAIAIAVPAVMGAAVPNPPAVPAYGGPGGPGGFPHPGPKHCIQEWFGTAPLCNGKCPGGWNVIYFADVAGSCQQSNPFKVIESCTNLSSHKCVTGQKALCERCLPNFEH